MLQHSWGAVSDPEQRAHSPLWKRLLLFTHVLVSQLSSVFQFLCPVISRLPALHCLVSPSSLFSPSLAENEHGRSPKDSFHHRCSDQTLNVLPAQTGPFTLVASHPGSPIDGKPINAGGLHFLIGVGAASYCPSPPVPSGACPPGNTTIFFNGALVRSPSLA